MHAVRRDGSVVGAVQIVFHLVSFGVIGVLNEPGRVRIEQAFQRRDALVKKRQLLKDGADFDNVANKALSLSCSFSISEETTSSVLIWIDIEDEIPVFKATNASIALT